MGFTRRKCHSYGSKLRHFGARSVVVLATGIWQVVEKTIDHFWKNDRSVVYGTIDRF